MENSANVKNQIFSDRELSQMKWGMRLSLGIGVGMLVLKMGAYLLTGSSAIFSDAAESVVHVLAVGFAAWSLRFSLLPADREHNYGHAKVSYFSAGFEGAMIALAAIFILYKAVVEIRTGPELDRLGLGMGITFLTVVINSLLGWRLLKVGRRTGALILEANGKHVLTDVWTSAGAILGLVLAVLTGWLYWDPICAILLAVNILFTGFNLIRRGVRGLMDQVDPKTAARLETLLERECDARRIRFHELRCRNLGNSWWVDLHLLFPRGTPIERAHEVASQVEDVLKASLPGHSSVNTHLEPIEGHDLTHHEVSACGVDPDAML